MRGGIAMERAKVKEQLERIMNEFNQKSDELQKMAEKSVNGTMERYTLAQADTAAAKLLALKELALRLGFAVVYDAIQNKWTLT
jgi:hypothetical protein